MADDKPKVFLCLACKKPLLKGQIVVGFSESTGAHSTVACMGKLGYKSAGGDFDHWQKNPSMRVQPVKF